MVQDVMLLRDCMSDDGIKRITARKVNVLIFRIIQMSG